MTTTATASGATRASAASRGPSSTTPKPEPPPSLAAALAALQTHLPRVGKAETGEVKGTSKDGRAYSYTYQYADLPAISDELLPMLGELGLSFSAKPNASSARWLTSTSPT